MVNQGSRIVVVPFDKEKLVEITVNNVNRPPELDSIGPKTVEEGNTLEFRVHAIDPDLDLITLDTLNAPENAVFVDSGNGAAPAAPLGMETGEPTELLPDYIESQRSSDEM